MGILICRKVHWMCIFRFDILWILQSKCCHKSFFSFRHICNFVWTRDCSSSLHILWCNRYHTSRCIPRWYLKSQDFFYRILTWCTFHCRNPWKFSRTFRDPTLFCNAARGLGNRIVGIWKFSHPVYLFFGKYLEDKRLARCPLVKSKNITWLGHLSFCFLNSERYQERRANIYMDSSQQLLF